MDTNDGGIVKTLREFEEYLTRNGWTVWSENVQPDDRPLIRQTVTGRQGEFLVRMTYTRRVVDGQPDQIDFNFGGAYVTDEDMKIRWFPFAHRTDFMRFVNEYDTTLLIPSGPEPQNTGPKCRCQKVRHASEEIARSVLRKARRERSRVKDSRRLEERVYPCPGDPRVFHLTALKEWADRNERQGMRDEYRTAGTSARRAGAVRPADPADGLEDDPAREQGRGGAGLPKVGDSPPWSVRDQGDAHEEGLS